MMRTAKQNNSVLDKLGVVQGLAILAIVEILASTFATTGSAQLPPPP